MARTSKKRKSKKNIEKGILHINSTFNNTIVTLTDEAGNVVTWASSGNAGFKGSRKSTPFAAKQAADNLAASLKDYGVKSLKVQLKGPGPGKNAAVESFQSLGIEITEVVDVTPVPHNGCRPPKKNRG